MTDVKTRLAVSLSAAGLLNFAASAALTIATGSITVTGNWARVDTEAAAASDYLDTITAGADGQVLFLRSTADARNVIIRHGVGNIVCGGATNITLDVTSDLAILIYDGNLSKWIAEGFMSAATVATAVSALARYGGFYAYNKAIPFQITVSNVYHALHLVTAGDLVGGLMSGFTFNAGRVVDSNITSEGNPSGTLLLITCAANHGLTTGQIVMLGNMNSASHDLPTRVTVTGLTTFTCDNVPYVTGAGASAGTVIEPAHLLASTGSAGIYQATFTLDGTAAAANKDWKFELNNNVTAQDNIVTERLSTNSLASMTSTGHITIADGDRLWLSGRNATDTGDYTVKNCNVSLHRI
jgi:hypothetical protein